MSACIRLSINGMCFLVIIDNLLFVAVNNIHRVLFRITQNIGDHVPAAWLPRIQDKNFMSFCQVSPTDFSYPIQTMLVVNRCILLTLAFRFLAVFQLLRQISFSTDNSCKYSSLRYPCAINSLKNAPQLFLGCQ